MCHLPCLLLPEMEPSSVHPAHPLNRSKRGPGFLKHMTSQKKSGSFGRFLRRHSTVLPGRLCMSVRLIHQWLRHSCCLCPHSCSIRMGLSPEPKYGVAFSFAACLGYTWRQGRLPTTVFWVQWPRWLCVIMQPSVKHQTQCVEYRNSGLTSQGHSS